jgi:hypothetical protein
MKFFYDPVPWRQLLAATNSQFTESSLVLLFRKDKFEDDGYKIICRSEFAMAHFCAQSDN